MSSSDEDDEDVWLCDGHHVGVSDNQEPISHTGVTTLLRQSRPLHTDLHSLHVYTHT